MPCYSPIQAYRDTRSGALFFWPKAGTDSTLYVPCGQCVGCRLERSRQWAARCMNEASLHEENCFITLTYKDAPKSLQYRDFQLFMKRLRRQWPGVRFYMCGEYGEDFGRPHYHAVLFGMNFPDRYRWRKVNGHQLYRSPKLEALWQLGHCEIGAVTFESAAYVARYCMKKITGDAAEAHYSYVDEDTGEVCRREPEFCHMSLKPGIGARWLEKYQSDVYPAGEMVVRGVKSKSPRYYDKLYRRVDRVEHDYMKSERAANITPAQHAEGSASRLKVREAVATARVSSLKRNNF